MKKEGRQSLGYHINNALGNPNTFIFETDNSIVYEVRFKPSGYIFANDPELAPFVFEMGIVVIDNPVGKLPPADSLIPPTIAHIFRRFFEQHERVVIYICDSSDQRGEARQRKFTSWFNLYQGGNYVQFNNSLIDENGSIYFVSLIIRGNNPYRHRLLVAFDELMTDSREDK